MCGSYLMAVARPDGNEEKPDSVGPAFPTELKMHKEGSVHTCEETVNKNLIAVDVTENVPPT